MSFLDFVRAASDLPMADLSTAEIEALDKIYRWGPGPGQAKAYRETHKLESWVAVAAHIEGLKP